MEGSLYWKIFIVASLTASSSSAVVWGEWSEWSACSRSCDGGAAFQTRQCRETETSQCSVASSKRYKICNMQQCPYKTDFRLDQCQKFNHVPYQGRLYSWVPYNEAKSPCSLYCKALNTSDLVVQFATKVIDGTRCSDANLDMCIDGICQSVGCDLQLGSTLKIDSCGVCGGNGTSCSNLSYTWKFDDSHTDCSNCSQEMREVSAVCVNMATGDYVAEQNCNGSSKPANKLSNCSTECPPKWVLGSWSNCSAACGGGTRTRRVYCQQGYDSAHVDDTLCIKIHGSKPSLEESCNNQDCPKWIVAPWSECSASCGEGVRRRQVICRDARGHSMTSCDLAQKPETQKSCHNPECLQQTSSEIPVTSHNLFDDSQDSSEPRMTPAAKIQKLSLFKDSPLPSALRSSQFVLHEPHVVTTDPSFVTGSWSECSTTCGQGFRKRKVKCRIFLEFSKTVADLPDFECPGPKPKDTESCFNNPCMSESNESNDQILNDSEISPFPNQGNQLFYWKVSGFTPCSASCLGGVQESIIQCIRANDSQSVHASLCPLYLRPDVITRTCNDIPCPPRWSVSEFSNCSRRCGRGIQKRQIQCMHEVARGSSNVLPVTFDLCPQPPPRTEQPCNLIDCPAQWKPGNWSKCSVSCGSGMKTRKIVCQQILALGDIIDKSPHSCTSPKPADVKPCDLKPCERKTNEPKILGVPQNFIQTVPKKRVNLKIGGNATVLEKTNVYLRCPVKNFDRSKIIWQRGNSTLESNGRLEINQKRMLAIHNVKVNDSSIYVCKAGETWASISISVRPAEILVSTPGAEKKPTHKSGNNDGSKLHLKAKHKVATKENESTDQKKPQTTTNARKSNKILEKLPLISDPEDDDEEIGELMRNTLDIKLLSAVDTKQLPVYKHKSEMNELHENQKKNPVSPKLKVTAAGHVDKDDTSHRSEKKLGKSSTSNTSGKSKKDVPKYEWLITPWSKCSQTCGGSGFQLRGARCLLRENNTTKSVESSFCESHGLQTPVLVQNCGLDKCPRWEAGPWTPCSLSKCFTWNTALQKREVFCRMANGTEVDPILCNEQDIPPRKRECYSDNCRSTWKMADWIKFHKKPQLTTPMTPLNTTPPSTHNQGQLGSTKVKRGQPRSTKVT